MVRLEGTGLMFCAIIALRIASAPESPRSLLANSPRNLNTSCSIAMLVRLTGFGAPAGRSFQSTRSSRLLPARSTHR